MRPQIKLNTSSTSNGRENDSSLIEMQPLKANPYGDDGDDDDNDMVVVIPTGYRKRRWTILMVLLPCILLFVTASYWYFQSISIGKNSKKQDTIGFKDRVILFDDDQNKVKDHSYFMSKYSEKYSKEIRPSITPIVDGRIKIKIKKRKFVSLEAWNDTFCIYNCSDTLYNSTEEEKMIEGGGEGDVVAFVNHFDNVHAHVLIDHLPAIAYLRQTYTNVTFLLNGSNMMKRILTWLDPTFVSNRVIWITWDTQNKVWRVPKGQTLYVWKRINEDVRNLDNWIALRRWIQEVKNIDEEQTESRKRVVYASRNSPGAKHHRAMDPSHEADIITMIKTAMDRHWGDVKKKLVIYTGYDKNNSLMSLQEQFRLFRSADVVIGAHGGALANVCWMGIGSSSFSNSSHLTPAVVEFMIGPGTSSIQHNHGQNYSKTYYNLYAGAFWINRYEHVLFAQNSTEDASYIDLNSLERALDEIWG